jgi:nicotinate-nucleotide adenylyltransferase
MVGRRKIGLLGGSFNPAHEGHLHISLEALKRLRLDEIWWLVSPQNPLKKSSDLAKYETRLEKARAMARHPRIRVLDIEAREKLFYTIDSIRYLQRAHPRHAFVWLMGADNLGSFHRWRAWRKIASLVPVAVLDRAPYGLKALHQPFARTFAAARLNERSAVTLAESHTPAWIYLTIPRHPLSGTYLRKTLGKAAFLRNNSRK